MSFNDDDRFNDRDSSEDDFKSTGSRRKEPRDFENDFFKDEDFELDGQTDAEIENEGFRTKRIKQRRKRRKAVFKILGIMFIVIVLAAGAVFGYRYVKNRFFSDVEIEDDKDRISIPTSLELTQDINMVIACADQDLLEPSVSSIIFSRYDSIEKKLTSLCIPVRTLLDIPGIGAGLIGDSAEAGGMDLLSLALENNLGMDMEVNHYLLLDIYNMVNKLDGITLNLDEDITVKNYDDDTTFELEKGENLIDGTEAVNFLKFYSGIEKDIPIGNITKQKMIVDAILSKIAGESEEDLAANLNLISDFIDTDMSMEEELTIFSAFAGVEPDKNNVYPLDVSPTELAEEEVVYVVGDISGLSEIFGLEEAKTEEDTTAVEETVNLTVWNGEGTPGLANEVSELLKGQFFESGKAKYNILEFANEPSEKFDYEVTEIILYSGESYVMEAADDIKSILGVGNITSKENEAVESDIIIILGADYTSKEEGTGDSEETSGVIKINILNGEGTAKLAVKAQELLEDHFNTEQEVLEVVETKDAENWDYEQTEIILFNSNEKVNELAQQIQEWMGVGIIKYSNDNVDNVDISIILGSDYTNR